MDYTAAAEGQRIVATWVAGTPESKELALCGKDADGSFLLSANVRLGEEGEEYPWYLTFYEGEESMCVYELGYTSWKDAVEAAEKWIADTGLDVDGQSIVPAAYELGYLLGRKEGARKGRGEGFALGGAGMVCDLLLQMLDAGCDYAELGVLAGDPSKCLGLMAEYGIVHEQGCC